jgi:hypothetical protein
LTPLCRAQRPHGSGARKHPAEGGAQRQRPPQKPEPLLDELDELLLEEFEELLLDELLDEFDELLLDEFEELLLEESLDELDELLLEELEAKRSGDCTGADRGGLSAMAPVAGSLASAVPTAASAAPAAVSVASILMVRSSCWRNRTPAFRAGFWRNGCAGMLIPAAR